MKENEADTPEAKSTWDKILAALPGASKLQKAETDLATATESITALQGRLSIAEAAAKDVEGQLKAKDAAHASAVEVLKAAHAKEVAALTEKNQALEAKEQDIDKRANTKAAAIAGNRGLNAPIAEEEGNPGGSGESAFKTYEQLMAEGKNAEASKFYAANAEAILKSRGK